MRRRQHIRDGLRLPSSTTLHLIPAEVYIHSYSIRVDHPRLEEALRSLSSIPGPDPYIISADYRPAPGSGYGHLKSYVVAITGLDPEEAARRFTDMPSRRATPVQYRVVDIIAAAISQVRASGEPYRRSPQDPHLNTSRIVAEQVISAPTMPMETARRMSQATTLLHLIRTSGQALPSRDMERVSRMDYVLEEDVRTASDLVRFIGGGGVDVTVSHH